MRTNYAGGKDELQKLSTNYLFSPIYTKNEILKEFPPTIFILAKHEILTNESLEFGKKLIQLGVITETHIFNKSIHLFYGRSIFEEGDQSLKVSAEFLRKYTTL
jgi:acetyl esterase/lipase